MDTVHFRRTLSRPCCLPPATLQSFSAEYAAAAPWPSLYLAYDGHSVNLKKQTGDLEVFALVFCFVSCLFVFDKKKKVSLCHPGWLHTCRWCFLGLQHGLQVWAATLTDLGFLWHFFHHCPKCPEKDLRVLPYRKWAMITSLSHYLVEMTSWS